MNLGVNLANALRLADRVRFRRGEVLVAQGQRRPEELWWVAAGRVKSFLLTDTGAERVLGFFGAGSVFGEETLLAGEGSAATYAGATDGVAYVLNRDALARLLCSDPGLTLTLLRALARKAHYSVKLVEEMTFLDVGQRVRQALVRLAAEEGGTIGITQQELANLVGASRVMVTNVLAELRQAGLIEARRGRLVVRDARGLASGNAGAAGAGGGRESRGPAAIPVAARPVTIPTRTGQPAAGR